MSLPSPTQREQIDSGTYTLKWYWTNVNHEGQLLGLRVTVGALLCLRNDSFDVGTWTWRQLPVTAQSNTQQGAVVLLRPLFTGQPGAFDDRSRAEVDLEKVRPIRTLAAGGMVQEYTIGGRNQALQDG